MDLPSSMSATLGQRSIDPHRRGLYSALRAESATSFRSGLHPSSTVATTFVSCPGKQSQPGRDFSSASDV